MKTQQWADRRGRVLRTAAQRQELVREWRAAGVTQVDFCARRGIHPTTFSTWCRDTAPGRGWRKKASSSVEFAEFKVPVGGTAPIEVELPNGVRIRLRDAGLCRELLPLLRGDAAC